MSSTAQGLESLKPVSEELHHKVAVAAAMAIIRPQHPNRSNELELRSGCDKRGNLGYYSRVINGDPDAWNFFRGKTRPELDEFLKIRERDECDDHRGPAGIVLHYHVSERP